MRLRMLLTGLMLLGGALPAPAEEAKTAPDQDAVAQVDAFIAGAGINKKDRAWRTKLPKPEKATFAPGRDYFAVMKTNKGTIRIQLLSDVAPMHVTSMIYLARLGYYDGLKFHRVIPRFMAQGGCPLGTGSGGPGYEMAGEHDPQVRHDRAGLLSAANRGPGTDGSQFFLTFVETPWLDGKHTIYGEVVDGMEVLKQLESAGSQSGATRETLTIESVTIE